MFLSVSYLLPFCFLVFVAAFDLHMLSFCQYFFLNDNTGQSSLIILQHHSLKSATLWRELTPLGLYNYNFVVLML